MSRDLSRPSTLDWDDTLLEFLAASNEDEAVASFFAREIMPKIASDYREKPVRWLEVGPGPGTKTTKVLTLLKHRCRLDEVKLLEPSAKWLEVITKTAQTQSILDSVLLCEETLQEFARHLDVSTHLESNLVTAIHVLYDESVAESFVQVLAPLARMRGAAWVVMESEQSELRILRGRINKRLGLQVPDAGYSRSIASKARLLGFSCDVGEIDQQRCNVDIDRMKRDPDYWLPRFLLGENLTSYSTRTATERSAVVDCVVAFLHEAGRSWLLSDDTSTLLLSGG